MGLSIICFKGSQVDFPNKCVLQSLNIEFIIANSADTDAMQQPTKIPFQGFPVYKGFIPFIGLVQSINASGAKKHKKKSSYLKPLGIEP